MMSNYLYTSGDLPTSESENTDYLKLHTFILVMIDCNPRHLDTYNQRDQQLAVKIKIPPIWSGPFGSASPSLNRLATNLWSDSHDHSPENLDPSANQQRTEATRIWTEFSIHTLSGHDTEPRLRLTCIIMIPEIVDVSIK